MPEFSAQFRFRDWPNVSIPDVAAGVYAVWRDTGELVYVGMSGRGLEARVTTGKRFGLWTRIASHARGRLNGDQFCVYVANRYVVPDLETTELSLFASGTSTWTRSRRDTSRSTSATRSRLLPAPRKPTTWNESLDAASHSASSRR